MGIKTTQEQEIVDSVSENSTVIFFISLLILFVISIGLTITQSVGL